jgi:hypothetical protein
MMGSAVISFVTYTACAILIGMGLAALFFGMQNVREIFALSFR